MTCYRNWKCVFLIAALACSALFVAAAEQMKLPEFGRYTVLVWTNKNTDGDSQFVVRIAELNPNRHIEWEDYATQGTILLQAEDLLSARTFFSARLFEPGVNNNRKGATAIWLSQQLFKEIKENKKVKCFMDGAQTSLAFKGTDIVSVDVNGTMMPLPVIKTADAYGFERWFLDQEDNPLFVKQVVRQFTQVLSSITTNKTNTLRWLKKKN